MRSPRFPERLNTCAPEPDKMPIEAAIQEYLRNQKEFAPRDQVEFDLAVLARLQEYLEGDALGEPREVIKPDDLRAFFRDWYRQDEDVTPEATERLGAALLGFARWLDNRADDSSAQSTHVAAMAPLADALPRTARIAALLRRHARREDLGEAIPVEEAAGGSPLGTISGGVNRVIRPEEIDYARAEEDTFTVAAIDERSVSLLSPSRAQLGEGVAGPVAVPVRVARLLRVGDVLHGEIAPTRDGWEVLNIETVYPGGLDDRP